eukprot:TRINITY_DN5350_c0_g6_i1.p1 TRINITY_DN5350_c0_g6~~TRINITY_DN5350_c0_g6_i1.p1  ORF type:complete len:326 (-),score=77.94 TRINITY_DN5350_c0_g6_i1:111-1088(-)
MIRALINSPLKAREMVAVSRAEEKAEIESGLKVRFSNEVFAVSKRWWDRWTAYANDSAEHPGPISNSDLLASDSSCADWSHMSLQPALVEYEDYVLVTHSVWLKLHARYKGGPEVRFFIVNNGTDERCRGGRPDYEPVKVKLKLHNMGKEEMTILVSIHMTGKQLYRYLNQKFFFKANSMEASYTNGSQTVKIANDLKCLKDYGIGEGSVLNVKDQGFAHTEAGTGSTMDEGLNLVNDEEYLRDLKVSLCGDEAAVSVNKYDKMLEYLDAKTIEKEGFEEVKSRASEKMKEQKLDIKTKDYSEIWKSLMQIEHKTIPSNADNVPH